MPASWYFCPRRENLNLKFKGNQSHGNAKFITQTHAGFAIHPDNISLGATGILGCHGAMTLSINAALASATYDLFSFTAAPTGHFDSIALTGSGPYTGSMTTSNGGITFTTSTGDLTVVPEPTSIALLVIGTTFLLWRRRKAAASNA